MAKGWSPVRLETWLKLELEAEARRMVQARENGHYANVPYSDRHGFSINSVVASLLLDRTEHRDRSRKQAVSDAKALLKKIAGQTGAC